MAEKPRKWIYLWFRHTTEAWRSLSPDERRAQDLQKRRDEALIKNNIKLLFSGSAYGVLHSVVLVLEVNQFTDFVKFQSDLHQVNGTILIKEYL